MNLQIKCTYILLLMFLITGCGGKYNCIDHSKVIFPQNQQQKSWEKTYFESITERINKSGTKSLNELDLPNGSTEIRIWVGFDATPLRGIILNQNGNDWMAYYIPPIKNASDSPTTFLLPPPKSGWENLCQTLDSLELLTLPDAEEIDMEDKYIDDSNVVVEIKTSTSYRTYRLFGFEIPKESHRDPVQKMLRICNFLSDEFEVQLCSY